MPDKYKWFWVIGTIVGWLTTGDEDNDCILEDDVAVVQTDDGHFWIRWLGNDYSPIDPANPEGPAIGAKISFKTNLSEQYEYTRLARGES
jgi:hypothetical protein